MIRMNGEPVTGSLWKEFRRSIQGHIKTRNEAEKMAQGVKQILQRDCVHQRECVYQVETPLPGLRICAACGFHEDFDDMGGGFKILRDYVGCVSNEHAQLIKNFNVEFMEGLLEQTLSQKT